MGSLVCAAPQLARVTTAAGLLINGKAVPQKAGPDWPLIANDQVTTTHEPATVMLPKGDRAFLDPDTSIRLLEADGIVTLELERGVICLRTVRESKLRVLAGGAQLQIDHPFEGSIELTPGQKPVVKSGGCRQEPGAFWKNKKVIIPAAAAGAAAAAAAAAASGEEIKPISPSQR
jgi:hypothetical protein